MLEVYPYIYVHSIDERSLPRRIRQAAQHVATRFRRVSWCLSSRPELRVRVPHYYSKFRPLTAGCIGL